MEILIETVNPGNMGSRIYLYALNEQGVFVRRTPADYGEVASWRNKASDTNPACKLRKDEGRYADNSMSFSSPTFRSLVLAIVPEELWKSAGNEETRSESYAEMLGGAVRKIRKQIHTAELDRLDEMELYRNNKERQEEENARREELANATDDYRSQGQQRR